ncbi:hypothetical protein E4U52_004847 [Claviceps spartinae]|nr:hypothetical protein E4U52_004847 [Claviceps spartinae]
MSGSKDYHAEEHSRDGRRNKTYPVSYGRRMNPTLFARLQSKRPKSSGKGASYRQREGRAKKRYNKKRQPMASGSGDYVLVSTKNINLRCPSKKLAANGNYYDEKTCHMIRDIEGNDDDDDDDDDDDIGLVNSYRQKAQVFRTMNTKALSTLIEES